MATLLTACGPSGPPLSATDIVVVAPLPGREFSAAYLTLHNQSRDTISIHRVSSPEFAKVEMHESTNVDDVIHMRSVDVVTIDAGSSTRFESGGKHLMLIDPQGGLLPGKSVSLQFEYDDDGIFIVSAPLRTRE